MGEHLIDGEFQSDKYPTSPRGKVPPSTKDPTAQDLLWEYAPPLRVIDEGFSADLKAALIAAGYRPGSESVLDRLAAQNWPRHLGEPGERVLLLAAQGFGGVGRRDAEKRAIEMAATCRDDGEAIELLKEQFQWNERADLPFPIRELLGFDRDGNWPEVYTQ